MRSARHTFPAALGAAALCIGGLVVPAGAGTTTPEVPAVTADDTKDDPLTTEPLIGEAEPVTPVAEEVQMAPVTVVPDGLETAADLEPAGDEQTDTAMSRRLAAPHVESDTPAGEHDTPEAQNEVGGTTETPDGQVDAGTSGDEDVTADTTSEDASALPEGTVVVTATSDVASEVAVAGVTWARGETQAVAGVFLRSDVDGSWTDWEELEVTDTENDLPADSREGTEPMAVIDAATVEMAVVADRPIDAAVTVWDPGKSEADELAALPEDGVSIDQTSAAGTATATFATAAMASEPMVRGTLASTPAIFTRADWGADESLRWGNVTTSSIQGVVVHHTAGTNNYTAAQVPGIIRGIYSYHAVTRNWGDVGYNIMVDKFGRAWEGRYGSIRQAIWGAHAAPYNSTMFGISVLGNHDLVPVSEAAMDTVARVTAWKFDQHGISAQGTVTINGVRLNRVVGHRDVGNTTCPGQYFYSRLGELRNRIAAYQVDTGDRSLDRDLTGDGLPDVVARVGGRVQILPGVGAGNVHYERQVGSGWYPERTIDAGDWDGDGIADLMLVDNNGQLWLYPGRPDGLWKPRVLIGRDWQAFDMISGGRDWDGDGTPDLVARLRDDGSLRLYPGNGSGRFESARQIGTGWEAMDLITMVGGVSNGNPTIAARVSATRELRFYRGNGRGGFLSGHIKVGNGWQTMRSFAGVGDRTGDGVPDLVTLDYSGNLWQYPGTRTGTLGTRTRLAQDLGDARAVFPFSSHGNVSGLHVINDDRSLHRWSLAVAGVSSLGKGWSTSVRMAVGDIDVTPIGDWDGDGRADLVVRTANGDLLLHRGTASGDFSASGRRIGRDWGTMTAIAGAGNWSGDGKPGILAYSEGSGTVWLYPGTGDGRFDPRIELASGLTGYDAFLNAGHWTGSRVPDLLMRGTDSNGLFAWLGNGPGRLIDRRQVGIGWGTMEQLVATGDFDGDGAPDVLAVDRARRIWLYPGVGDGRFGSRVSLGTLSAGVTSLS